MEIKNMAYWKAKNAFPGINNDFEKGNNLPDGRSKSSPFQKHDGTPNSNTETHFSDGSPKSKRDKFNDQETKNEIAKEKKPKESGQKEGQYTTYGDPDFYYDNSGKKINSANVDEGELSTVKTDENGRKYVEKSSEAGGGKLYLDPK